MAIFVLCMSGGEFFLLFHQFWMLFQSSGGENCYQISWRNKDKISVGKHASQNRNRGFRLLTELTTRQRKNEASKMLASENRKKQSFIREKCTTYSTKKSYKWNGSQKKMAAASSEAGATFPRLDCLQPLLQRDAVASLLEYGI